MLKKIEFNWENLFLSLLWLFSALIIVVVAFLCFSTKSTKQYTLGGSGGELLIDKEMEWDFNSQIKLDRSITYWEAIKMVDSLNQTLKK